MTTQEIKDILSKGEVKFSYEKKDGTIREAFGTRNILALALYDAIPTGDKVENDAIPTGDKVENDNIIPYFDLDVMAWRSFKAENFMGILD